MKGTIVIAILQIVGSICFGQIPAIVKAGDSLYFDCDSGSQDGDATHICYKGWLNNGKRNGVWHEYMFHNSDTTKKMLQVTKYENGIVKKTIIYSGINCTSSTEYDMRQNPTIVLQRCNDILVKKDLYESKTKRHSTTYHLNGQISAEGRSRGDLVKGGCDAGDIHWRHSGKWKYFDEEGNKTDAPNE